MRRAYARSAPTGANQVESDNPARRADRDRLPPEAVELYGRITRHEPLAPEDGPVLARLRERGLVAVDADLPDIPIALDPQEAARRQLDADLREMVARAARMAAIPEDADELSVHFERAKWRSGRGSEFLTEPGLVNARIEHAISQAQGELLTAQPGGPRSRELLAIAMDRDSRALERGVSVRTLYRDSVRDDEATREWARVMTGKGAQFRTLIGPFQRCIIVDRRTAFISDHIVNSVPSHAAWHVLDRAAVAYMAEGFDQEWRRAEIWHGDPRVSDVAAGARTTRLQREILRDTAAGIEQRITAQRLGIGLRTLSKEIGKLRELWQVSTLAELTYRWAMSAERLIDDE